MDERDVGGEQVPESLRRTTFRGAKLGFAGYVLSNAITFGAYIVLARLITPSDFGRYAAASVLVGIGALFAESGMMSAIIQRSDRVQEAAATAFYALLVSGVLLTLVTAALAPALGAFFATSNITGLAAALSGLMLLRALTIVPDALLQRRFSFARRVAVDPLGAAMFAAASITACANGAGPWGLVAGAYASMLAQVTFAWAFARFRPHPKLASIAMWRELTAFARHVLGSEILARVANQLDTLMLGKFSGSAPLGQYRNGLRLAQQPANTFISVAAYVLLPALARIAHERERLASVGQRILNLVAVGAIPISFALLPLGEPAAILLLGHRWRTAGHVIAALFPIVWAGSTISACSEIFKAVARPRLLMEMWFVNLCAMVVLMPLTAAVFGAVGVAAGVSASQLVTMAYALQRVSPLIAIGARDVAHAITGPIAAGALMAGAMLAFGAATDPLTHPTATAWLLTLVQVLVGVVSYALVLLAIDGPRRHAARTALGTLKARLRSA